MIPLKESSQTQEGRMIEGMAILFFSTNPLQDSAAGIEGFLSLSEAVQNKLEVLPTWYGLSYGRV